MSTLASRRALWIVVALAALVRVALLVANVASRPELFGPGPAARQATAFADPSAPVVPKVGFEVGNVAYALACTGEGYASPFGGGTGPTAWVAPGLVAAYAVAFALLGCMTGGAVLALFAVALAASLVSVLLAHDAGARLDRGDARAPVLAALLVALSPWNLRLFDAGSLLDLHLPTAALLLLLALLLRLRETPSTARLAGFAAAVGGATLVNPVLAAVAAVGLGLLVWRRRVLPGRAAATLAVALLVLLGPYLVWQRARLDGWVFVKSNFPFELHLGDRAGTGGVLTPKSLAAFHPSQNAAEYRAYRRAGELAYVRSRGRAFLRGFDPGRFARATARRAAHFFFLYREMPWDGGWRLVAKRALAALPGIVLLAYPFARRRRHDGDLLVYGVVLTYAAPYLLVGMVERYMVPATGPVLVLAAGAVSGVWSRWRRQPGAAAATVPSADHAAPRTRTTSGGSGRQAGDASGGP